MATQSSDPELPVGKISVEEYLKSMYHPDCDYVDGAVLERNFGDKDHSSAQGRLLYFFHSRSKENGLCVIPEWRFMLKPTRFRIPDLVVTRGKPKEQILTKAPLLCIEILSPQDKISRINDRVRDYLEFGVPVVWVIDPAERRVWIYRATGMQEATGDSVHLDGTDIQVPFSEVFERLNV